MRLKELKQLLCDGALEKYSALYPNLKFETGRMIAALDTFAADYGDERDVAIFTVPGRSELIGNHTDHNHGSVMAGAITRDIIAVASKNSDGAIRFRSEGYSADSVKISDTSDPKKFKRFTSRALVAGVIDGFVKAGYAVGGYDAYSTTEVLKGSGLSSSAAFEVMIGNIMNHFYSGGAVDNKEIAKISQYSENVYFGKPCGLMDQMACAVGSFVYIDFADPKAPIVEPIDLSLSKYGYKLCIVNTGGSHSNLNDDYAAVPAEMKAVAAHFGRDVLRGLTRDDILGKLGAIREKIGDRAVLRALHFVDECERVEAARRSLCSGDLDGFLDCIIESGSSSYKYLQNVYTNKAPEEQGISVALNLSESYLKPRHGAWRVHGGGFAGTVQAFVRECDVDGYKALMESVFGEGAVMTLDIRPVGAAMLFG